MTQEEYDKRSRALQVKIARLVRASKANPISLERKLGLKAEARKARDELKDHRLARFDLVDD